MERTGAVSISAVSTERSAVWSIYQFNPTQPTQPPNFGQYVNSGDTPQAAGIADSSPLAPSGGSKIGADLGALLLDLQSNSSKSVSASATSTSTTTSGASPNPAPGSGDLVSDMNAFFGDLQSAGTAQTPNGASGSRHHHHSSPPTLQGSFDPSGAASLASSDLSDSAPERTSSSRTNNLLGYMAKALQNYGSLNSGNQTQSSVALSA